MKCNYVEWVDTEWSVATKFCLRELWSMYDDKLRQNVKNAEEKCMLIGEKRRTEEELRFFKMDFAKMVADKEDASHSWAVPDCHLAISKRSWRRIRWQTMVVPIYIRS